MAKTKGAMFSLEASGAFAQTIVYDKRGHARLYKIPHNPKTEAQGNQRQRMINAQRAIARIGSAGPENAELAFLTAYRQSTPDTYRWRAYLMGEMTKEDIWTASATAWGALDSTAKTAWNTHATGMGIIPRSISYASEDTPSAGQALWHLAQAINASGTAKNVPGSAPPSAINAEWWADVLAGS